MLYLVQPILHKGEYGQNRRLQMQDISASNVSQHLCCNFFSFLKSFMHVFKLLNGFENKKKNTA